VETCQSLSKIWITIDIIYAIFRKAVAKAFPAIKFVSYVPVFDAKMRENTKNALEKLKQSHIILLILKIFSWDC